MASAEIVARGPGEVGERPEFFGLERDAAVALLDDAFDHQAGVADDRRAVGDEQRPLDARLHHAIPTETRATIAAVKSFAGQVTMTGMLMIFGVLAQGVSYRAAFMGCGGAIALIGLGALVRNRLRGGAG